MTKDAETLSVEEANALVLEYQGWAESIARSVARAWNLDWQLDGLDGAAMEALIFCSRRFKPDLGVPFKGYARKRIHEASTEAAKKSRGWRKVSTEGSEAEKKARQLSTEILEVFPELRMGEIPYSEDFTGEDGDDMRGAIRALLVGASIIAAKQGIAQTPDDMLDYRKMVGLMDQLDVVHQSLLWQVYWEGVSMRSVASDWGVDELSVIREHQSLLAFLQKGFSKSSQNATLRVRPALKDVAIALKKKGTVGPFTELLERGKVTT